MVKRISRATVVTSLVVLFALGTLAQADTTLVNYNFDYDVLESGPDTYQIFEHKNAKAEISNKYAAGGYASAHLLDEAGDKDFVELQGYFPEQQNGQARFRFKLLIAGETDLFNVALVGRERYKLSPLGINFWLIYEQGWFKHNSDSIPKKLFQPNLFEWYTIDALLDLERGDYSLRISNEAGALLTDLTHQPMAAGKSDHYSLKEFSFVGDLADTAPADFYIDDIYISTTNETNLPAFVAPGRRKYFYEIWDDYHRQLQGKMQCLPARSLTDFGINASDYAALATKGQLAALYDATQTHVGKPIDTAQSSIELLAVKDWMNACQNLAQNKLDKARVSIKQALEKKPNAYIFQLTQLIIDAASSPNDTGLYSRALALPNSADDLRHQIVLSMLAFHNQRYAEASHQQDVQTALAWLGHLNPQDIKQLNDLGLQALSENYIAQLQRLMPGRWEPHKQWMLILEQQYYSLLWQQNYHDAYALATRVTKTLAQHNIAPGIWLERQADGAFMARDLDKALDLFNHQAPLSLGSLLKMADMYHMQGDLASEKSIRESIYKNFSRNTTLNHRGTARGLE